MSQGKTTFGNVSVNIGSNAKLKSKESFVGISQLNIGAGSNDHGGEKVFGDVDVSLGEDVNTRGLIYGYNQVNVTPDSFTSILADNQEAFNSFSVFLGNRTDLPLNIQKDSKKEVIEFIRKEPFQVLSMLKSICLVQGPSKFGTGFLAEIPQHNGIILFSTGDNFDREKNLDEDETDLPFDEFLNKFTFYFKCYSGKTNDPGVVPLKMSDLTKYQHAVVLSYKGQRIRMGSTLQMKVDDAPEELNYFALLLDGKAKHDLFNKFGLDALPFPDLKNHKLDMGENLVYSAYPSWRGEQLKFSTGKVKKQINNENVITYDLDSDVMKPGAPVLDKKYQLAAIHLSEDTVDKVNMGLMVTSVIQDLASKQIIQ